NGLGWPCGSGVPMAELDLTEARSDHHVRPDLRTTEQESSPLPEVRRRLAAILAADVVGYTRLMATHEVDTHTRLMQLRSEVLNPGVAAQRGRIVKNTGDGFLATFDTARDATRCALSLQEAVTARTAALPADQRISYRMG